MDEAALPRAGPESGWQLTEGDVNTSSRRAEWQRRALGAEGRRLVDEDGRYFLRHVPIKI